MKVLIINPPIRLTDKPRHIPHGLAILANVVRKKLGIAPKVIDINAHRYTDGQLESLFKTVDFDVVLIGGLIPVYKRIVKYAETLKKIKP
jgi:anaerobic magnesium-protoporphyrin IX monomethyl ester cyclase